MNKRLREAFNFFRDHAGYCVGHKAEGALALARAEQEAKDRGLVFVWEGDDDVDDSFVDTWTEKDRKEWEKSEHFAEWCRVLPAGSDAETYHGLDILASLAGIIDADRDYRRVIEAELAVEALERIYAGEDSEKDTEGFERTCFAL